MPHETREALPAENHPDDQSEAPELADLTGEDLPDTDDPIDGLDELDLLEDADPVLDEIGG